MAKNLDKVLRNAGEAIGKGLKGISGGLMALGTKGAKEGLEAVAEKAGKEIGEEVVETASKKAIVIGEGMGDIKTVAKQLQSEGIDAKWYQAWSKNFPTDGAKMTDSELKAALARNKRWIDGKMKDGYEIFDLGLDPSRTQTSPFYALEKNQISNAGYPTIDISGRRP